MPGRMPPTSQLDWLISTTAMIVLFWSRATRDLLKSFGWGIATLHRLIQRRSCHPRRPPHSISPLEEPDSNLYGAFHVKWSFGLLAVLCSEVCPGKASMFSRRQSCRGRSQSPVVRIAEEMETEPSKPIDKISRGEITSHRAVSKENALWPRKK